MNKIDENIENIFSKFIVTEQGEVINKLTSMPKKKTMDRGYYYVSFKFSNKKFKIAVHRLVAMAHVPGYLKGLTVDHIDCNKTNNHYANLRWLTIGENTKESFRKGTQPNVGENVWTNKLNLSEVEDIRKSKLTSRKLGILYGVSKSSILNIKSGKSWKFSHILKPKEEEINHENK